MATQTWTTEAIIEDVFGRPADVAIDAAGGQTEGRLCRWRHFVGAYDLPALPTPVFVVHLGGKRGVRHWDRDGWSDRESVPGAVSIVPSHTKTRWLVDGELDVVTLSLPTDPIARVSDDLLSTMHFALADPLSVALTRQIVGELYTPDEPGRDSYLGSLVSALRAHVLRGRAVFEPATIPSAATSAQRIHPLIKSILSKPEDAYPLEQMAAQAGLTTAHFCRVFKRATGASPHQFILRAKIDRAKRMLEQSELSVGLIAEHLGFSSQGHFTKAFGQHVGATPSQYRATFLHGAPDTDH